MLDVLDSNSDIGAEDGLIERIVDSSTLLPGANWKTEAFDGEVRAWIALLIVTLPSITNATSKIVIMRPVAASDV